MDYYFRFVTKRVPINRFGKLGFKTFKEYFITHDKDFVDQQNYRKQIKFKKDEDVYEEDIIEMFEEGTRYNVVYSMEVERG